MRKTFFFFFIFIYPLIAQSFELKIIHYPKIKSRFDKVVIIPSNTTPYEFYGYIEEKIKENTNLEIVDRKKFSTFLKKEEIGKENITEKELITIYKAFGNTTLIFLNLIELSVKKKDLNGTPCKKGKIKFSISAFHSRDGFVLKNKTIEYEITMCSKTPIYPATEEIVEKLFYNSTNEILKTIWPWIEILKFPDLNLKICKNKKIFDFFLENNLKNARKIFTKNKTCYQQHLDQYFLIEGYLNFLNGNILEAKDFLKKAYKINKNEKLKNLILKMENLKKNNIIGMSIITKQKNKESKRKKQLYVNQYKNSADILLEKLSQLEKQYKEGKISKEEYMNKKYKLIEQY